jgi:hypothetical protein
MVETSNEGTATHSDYLQFTAISGLRKTESIRSYNLIIELSHENRLEEYYDESKSCLEHFRFPEMFIRRTKNAYITFIDAKQVKTIESSKQVSYEMIRKKLERRGMSTRLSLLRSTWATFMENQLSQAEVDLLQGRVNQSVFMRYYFAPDLEKLGTKVLAVLRQFNRQCSHVNAS